MTYKHKDGTLLRGQVAHNQAPKLQDGQVYQYGSNRRWGTFASETYLYLHVAALRLSIEIWPVSVASSEPLNERPAALNIWERRVQDGLATSQLIFGK